MVGIDKRTELLKFLKSEGIGDPEVDHAKAEELILELLGDQEITQAWKDCPQTWWYA